MLELFLVFAKMGLFTFGGGYAMLPILQREVVDHKKWASEQEILEYYAIGQCTPGIIAINTSTFIGYRKYGILGAIIASVGFVFPSLIIILIIAQFLKAVQHLALIKYAFSGIRIVISALVVHTVFGMFKKSVIDSWTLCIAVSTFVLVAFWNVTPIIPVVGSFLIGNLIRKNYD